MDYFTSVERQLEGALRRRARSRRRGRPQTRNGRIALVLALCVLTAGSALAATGVIPLGSPVGVTASNPRVGSGVPARGGSVMLGLTYPDPEGGPPWGMRLVHTTRGLLCLQVARVQDGRLGELGVDGAFQDDGRFHPLPAGALPGAGAELGAGFSEVGEDSICHLPREAFLGERVGVERSATDRGGTAHRPRAQLRDLYFGLLGPNALSVGYSRAGVRLTQDVVWGVGAFLIVTATSPADQPGTGGGSMGTAGGLAPVAPISSIAYRLHGSICERMLPRVRSARPCPAPQSLYPVAAPPARPLHVPLRTSLVIPHRVVRAALVSFKAPLAVDGAAEQYELRTPLGGCHGTLGGYGAQSTDRDIRAGAAVTIRLDLPFVNACGRRSLRVAVYFLSAGQPDREVATAVLHMPAGARP